LQAFRLVDVSLEFQCNAEKLAFCEVFRVDHSLVVLNEGVVFSEV
jgi:hypothetical protein